MSRPHMDENELARFLDRRMSEEERASAVAHLSESGPDAGLLADAAYLLRELGTPESAPAEDTPEARHPHADDRNTGRDPQVVELRPPSTARTRPRRVSVRWMALAAVLAGVTLIPVAVSRFGSGGPAGPGEYVALLGSPNAGLPARWTVPENRPWGQTRGGAPQGDSFGETDDSRTAARIGVLLVDLELAVASNQSAEANSLCLDVNRQIAGIPGGAGMALACDGLNGDTFRSSRDLLAEYFSGDVHFAAGSWAEAARLAAARHDAGFFDAKQSRRALDRFVESDDLAPSAREAAQRVQAQLQTRGSRDWATLDASLAALVDAAHRPVTSE